MSNIFGTCFCYNVLQTTESGICSRITLYVEYCKTKLNLTLQLLGKHSANCIAISLFLPYQFIYISLQVGDVYKQCQFYNNQ